MKVKEESEKVGLKPNIQKTKIMASGPITSWQIDGEMKQWETLYFGSPKSLQMVTAAMKSKDTCSLEEKFDQPRQHIKKQRHYFANKGLSSQSYGFPSSHVWMWELNHKEGWAPKNWYFLTAVLEKTLESRLDCKEIKPVNPKGNQSWIVIGRTNAEAKTPILWPPDAKRWHIWKDPDAGKDWRQDEKGLTEHEMVRWHHRLNGHEFEWIPGVGDGQGGLACCSPWGHKESDTTELTDWPTPVFWPGEFHGPYSPWCCKELDTTERLNWIKLTRGPHEATSGSYT